MDKLVRIYILITQPEDSFLDMNLLYHNEQFLVLEYDYLILKTTLLRN